jgi:hypothetical protein
MHWGHNIPDNEHVGLTNRRLVSLRQQIQDLGVVQINQNDDKVEFRIDNGSIINGDSYKGYAYIQEPPEHQRAKLDWYRESESNMDRFGNSLIYEPLKGHWYLFLFVNR